MTSTTNNTSLLNHSQVIIPSAVYEQRDEKRFYQLQLNSDSVSSYSSALSNFPSSLSANAVTSTSSKLTEEFVLQSDSASSVSATDRLQILKKEARRHGFPTRYRGAIWLSLLGLKQGTIELSRIEAKYRVSLEKINKECPGCEALLCSHLPTFGSTSIKNSFGNNLILAERAWTHNVWRHHCLSPVGIKAAKRILLVIEQDLTPEYCTVLPDLVCVLLLYLPEAQAYAVVKEMVERSRRTTKTRWHESQSTGPNSAGMSLTENGHAASSPSDQFFFATDKRSSYVLARTFMDELKSRSYSTYRFLIDFEPNGKATVESIFRNWFERLMMPLFPLKHIVCMIDCLLTEGVKVLYRFGLAALKIFKKEIEISNDPYRLLSSSIHTTISVSELASLVTVAHSGTDQDATSFAVPPRASTRTPPDLVSPNSSSGSDLGFGQSAPDFDARNKSRSASATTFENSLRDQGRSSERSSSTSRFSSFLNIFSAGDGGRPAAGSVSSDEVGGDSKKIEAYSFESISKKAFGIRNLRRDEFHKNDVKNLAEVASDVTIELVASPPLPHFGRALVTDSNIVKDFETATRLSDFLPAEVRPRAKMINLEYSTEFHGRSLGSLYRATAEAAYRNNFLVIVRALNPTQRDAYAEKLRSRVKGEANAKVQLNENDWMTFGFYTTSPLMSDANKTPRADDEQCFVFRLCPAKDSHVWRFRPSHSDGGAGEGGVGSFANSVRSIARPNLERPQSKSPTKPAHNQPEKKRVSQYSKMRRQQSARREVDAPRMRFVSCRRDSIWVGAVSHVELKEGKLIEGEDSDSDREEDAKLQSENKNAVKMGGARVVQMTRTRMVGPALWLDEDLLIGQSGYSNTFKNDPLCIHVDDPTYERTGDQEHQTRAHMKHYYFEISALEVYSIPKL